jgi:hypothetical protein
LADYATPTVVLPVIPNQDMTPLEKLLLGQIFEVKNDGRETYFFSQAGPAEQASLDRTDLGAVLQNPTAPPSPLAEEIKRQLSLAPRESAYVALDLARTPFTRLFQNIILRSNTVRYVAIISSFVCTKMRPDGFGGQVTLVTDNRILRKSTYDVLDEFLAETGLLEQSLNPT